MTTDFRTFMRSRAGYGTQLGIFIGLVYQTFMQFFWKPYTLNLAELIGCTVSALLLNFFLFRYVDKPSRD